MTHCRRLFPVLLGLGPATSLAWGQPQGGARGSVYRASASSWGHTQADFDRGGAVPARAYALALAAVLQRLTVATAFDPALIVGGGVLQQSSERTAGQGATPA